MSGYIRPSRIHGAVGVGIPLVATPAVLFLLRGSFSAYLVLGVWLLFANLTTFAYYGYDKFQAMHGGRRVPEVVLHLLSILGGSLGAYLTMRAFRHKTIKGGFRIIFWFIVFVQLAACAVAAYGVFALDKPY